MKRTSAAETPIGTLETMNQIVNIEATVTDLALKAGTDVAAGQTLRNQFEASYTAVVGSYVEQTNEIITDTDPTGNDKCWQARCATEQACAGQT